MLSSGLGISSRLVFLFSISKTGNIASSMEGHHFLFVCFFLIISLLYLTFFLVSLTHMDMVFLS